ncbi:MAG: hypothetical protein NTW05_07275 [Pseudonocardiales bacterium]|nr:hypothetical protein [Pseudonocardiales bacterium]
MSSPSAVPPGPRAEGVPTAARLAAFLLALVLVTAAGWTAGVVLDPPLPGPRTVPVLPRPAVLGGPGHDGHPAQPGEGR